MRKREGGRRIIREKERSAGAKEATGPNLRRTAGGPAEWPDPLRHAAEVGPARHLPALPAVVGTQDHSPRDAARAWACKGDGEAVSFRRRSGGVEGGGGGGGGRGEGRGRDVGRGDGAAAAEELEGRGDLLGGEGGR